jgi:hypothetical protein
MTLYGEPPFPCIICGAYHPARSCSVPQHYGNIPSGIEDTLMQWTTSMQSYYPGFQTCPVCKGTGSVFDDLLPTAKERVRKRVSLWHVTAARSAKERK